MVDLDADMIIDENYSHNGGFISAHNSSKGSINNRGLFTDSRREGRDGGSRSNLRSKAQG
jgi:hypothetical protein